MKLRSPSGSPVADPLEKKERSGRTTNRGKDSVSLKAAGPCKEGYNRKRVRWEGPGPEGSAGSVRHSSSHDSHNLPRDNCVSGSVTLLWLVAAMARERLDQCRGGMAAVIEEKKREKERRKEESRRCRVAR
jgi:hypothetical protein